MTTATLIRVLACDLQPRDVIAEPGRIPVTVELVTRLGSGRVRVNYDSTLGSGWVTFASGDLVTIERPVVEVL